ncbi:hypothetical protein EJ05DRAFT_228614 [Pseudovirgaria hyperparasitica]|uniref:Cryptic loci regulator 2 C-terminal domain-containing protein n=1 Tax=Pseudovirgaria hyperparasitica TaxID=470096 RepID=A0A6A6VUQ2_9PEZI|nr:uncharacterized protein EJ05DRAFT_228614 [Pseudovirgaria hyperparasitica]KAF2752987.1 hypothetical protein EJ05DRAFT_228614 [Pseudovirgaria hyperparasitica]
MGPKKRFRSPADFFPHLLWLCTDVNGNTDNCSCKLCCPEEIEEKKAPQAAQSPINKEEPEVMPEPKDILPPQGTINESSNRSLSNLPSLVRKQSPVPQLATTPPTVPAPSQLPTPRSIDQQIDTSFNKFHNRTAEIVWFQRGQAWALGVITRRYRTKNEQQQEARHYVIQPLSYPLHNPPLAIITDESHLRPWLAWSPPPLTHQSIHDQPIRIVPYHSIDWVGVSEGKYGPGEVEVDASILAAKSVEDTFTLTEPLKRTTSGGVEEKRWNCIFLGGEKIWLGDSLRLRIAPGNTVMALTEIIERVTKNQSTYTLVGDLYSLVALSATSQEPPENRNIPIRMREDLKWRNGITNTAKRGKSYWKLIQNDSRLSINQIKGRWYEDSYLLPLLSQNNSQLQQELANGQVTEQNGFLNSRGDSTILYNSQDNPGIRCADRKDAFGKSIPAHTVFASGIDPPAQSQRTQQQQTQPQNYEPQSQSQSQSQSQQQGLEQFVNLDGEEVPGFGQQYSSQGQEQGFF